MAKRICKREERKKVVQLSTKYYQKQKLKLLVVQFVILNLLSAVTCDYLQVENKNKITSLIVSSPPL